MNQDKILNNSVFWVDIDKIAPNPYQPRKEFNEEALKELSDSIKQYGILQPLTVSRKETDTADGGFETSYELIAGERRLRASKLAGLKQLPVIIRIGDDSKTKLELAIIENLQREDLNPVDRAKAFSQLQTEFNFKHAEIAQKMGKSREYVANSIRLLALPSEILEALAHGKISEGHTRPLLMLTDKKDEQMTLFREMLIRKMTVREAEGLARKVAQDKVRKKQYIKDPNILEIESGLGEKLGTRVHIEKRDVGGVITIDFFSYDDLENIVAHIKSEAEAVSKISMKDRIAMASPISDTVKTESVTPLNDISSDVVNSETETDLNYLAQENGGTELLDDRSKEESKKDLESSDDSLYDIKNFSI